MTHYQEYRFIRDKYGINVVLFFIDEERERIYGQSLEVLEEPTVVEYQGFVLEYPLTQGGIIYFPLKSMITVADIPDAAVKELKSYSTRNPKYNYGGANGS